MADATAGVITPETMERLTTASANGRLLLATLAGWLDREAGPAMAALNDDLRGLSDAKARAAERTLTRRGNPAVLADAMTHVLDTLGSVRGMTGHDWRHVRALAGEWLLG